MKIRLSFLILLMNSFLVSYSQSINWHKDNRQQMIIVTPNEFILALKPFVDAKRNDYIDCNIITIDSGKNFNAIKLKIDNAYSQTPADYLLLVGDFEHIPAFVIEEGLSDIHYAFDNENDIVPRMAVGRFSIENEQDLQTMIARSIIRKPFSGHVVGIASQEVSELTQKTDYEQIRLMGETLFEKGFTSISELFDGSQGGFDMNGNPTYIEVLKTLNKGSSWLNYAGYGSYDGWNTSGFEMKHIDSLNDNIELPIIVSASCLGGHFAGRTCFAEKWMRASKNGNPIGATAVMMSSSLTDWDAILSAMLAMSQNLPLVEENCRLGDVYLQMHSYIVNEMQRPKDANCWVLFGDPALKIYPSSDMSMTNHISVPIFPIIYPNPAHEFITVNTINRKSEMTYQLFDMQGRMCKQGELKNENNIIDISSFNSGIYFIRLTDGKQLYSVEKVIKY